MKRRTFLQASAAATLPLSARESLAQAWPARPITFVYAYPAGGGADPLARLLAQELKGRLNQPVVVENRTGAAGTIGAAAVAKAPADGHTFLFNVSQELVIAPWLYPQLPYNAEKSFAPVCRVATLPLMLVAHPGAGIKSVADLIARAKAEPGRLTYASAGTGSLQHLSAEVMQRRAGLTLNHIPYKGVAEATRDLLGGQVMMGFVGASTVVNHVKEGRLVPLGLSSTATIRDLPQVRPLAASPELAGFDLPQWFGIVAPAGTPAAAIDGIAAAVSATLDTEAVRANLVTSGMSPAFMGPAEYGRFIAEQRQIYGRVVREANIKL